MHFLRRPVVWVVALAAMFAVTVGGPSFSTLGPLSVDNPDEESLFAALGTEPAQPGAQQVVIDPGAAGSLPLVEAPEPKPDAKAQETRQARKAPEGLEGEEAQAVAGALAETQDGVGGPTEEEAAFVGSPIPRVLVHRVRPGETLSTIAAKYGIKPETIKASNDLPNADLLQVGQTLNILSVDGALHKVKRGENLWEIARTYRTEMDEIALVNGLDNPSRIRPDQELVIPGIEAATIGSGIRSEQLVSANGRLLRAFSWPVQGRVSSRYGPRWGRMHHGVDLAVNTGTPVRAAARGRVSFAGWNGGYGNLVVIDHGNGIETRYAHNSRIVARAGEYVERGEIIAYSGNTGNSTGPHVHFEIRQRGNSVNPLNYLR